MFGFGESALKDETDEDRIAKCISVATHGTPDHWRLYIPAARALQARFYVDCGRLGSSFQSFGSLFG